MSMLVSTGQITIVDTNDGLNLRLTNGSHVVPTDLNGLNGNFTGCATTAGITLGSLDDSANWTVTATPSAGVTGSLSGKTYTVTAMSNDTGYVDFTATRVGSATLTARFTVAKARAGQNFVVNYATAELWTANTTNAIAAGKYGGDFYPNGDGNQRVWATDPFGRPALTWRTVNNDVTGDADGGWDKFITGVDSNKSYMSVTYIRKLTASSDGSFYHGCEGSSTLNLDGVANGNPYFSSFGIGSFDLNEWYVSIGFIKANGDTSANSNKGGLYKLSTGAQVMTYTDFRMAAGATTQSHRTYLYYSSDPAASLEWWSPGFFEINGNEPKLRDLVGNPNWYNGNISVDINGALQGIGSGSGTTVSNNLIGINASGQLYGAGAGNGLVVSNNQVYIDPNGAVQGIGTGTGTFVNNAIAIGAITSGAGGLLPNWNLDLADANKKPAGLVAVEGIADSSGIAFGDATNSWVNISHPTDTTISYGFPAIPINDSQVYTVTVRHKTDNAAPPTTGLYLYFCELNTFLPQGKTHVGGATTPYADSVALRTSANYMYSGAAYPSNAGWVTITLNYVPTAGTKFASFCMANWNQATTTQYHVDAVYVTPKSATLYRQATQPSGGTYVKGDTWINTSGAVAVTSVYDGSAWQISGNYTTNTNQLTDGALLGSTASWVGVTGAGKPLDNAGRVLDTRNTNDAPSAYSTGNLREFKFCSAVGLTTAATYCVVETIKGWSDNSGGEATQWAYVTSGEVWKRSAGNGATAWGAWIRDIDRALYTGALDATRNVHRGNWADATAYAIGDTVIHGGYGWSCITAHTSSASILPPTYPTGSNTYWTLASVKGTDAKLAYLTASSLTFTVARDGTVTPSSITILAVGQGVAGSPTFSVTSGTATLTTTAGASFTTLTAANLTTDQATIKTIWDGREDTITITKVREGTDSISVVLGNEAHTAPASNAGVVSSYTGSGTAIQVFEGTTALNASATATTSAFRVGTLVTAPSGKLTTGAVSYSGATATIADHSAMDGATDSVTVGIPITVYRANGTSVTINKTQTVSKAKAGPQGNQGIQGLQGATGATGLNFSEAKSLFLDPTFQTGDNSVALYNNLGNGNTIITREAKQADSPFADSGFNLKISNIGTASPGLGGFINNFTGRANAVFVQRFIAKIPVGYTLYDASNPMGDGYTVTWLTSTAGTGKFQEYIVVRRCGPTGSFSGSGHIYLSGTAGNPAAPVNWYLAYSAAYDFTAIGFATVTGVLSNESHTVSTDSVGNNGNFTGAATTMTIFNGASDDSANWTVTAAAAAGVTGSLAGKTYTVTAMTVDTGYVDLTAARSGFASVVKRFTLTKAKAGTAGAAGATGATGPQGPTGSTGAQGPAVVITPNRPATFTSTDGTLDGAQADIVYTAAVSGIASPTYVWTFSGLQTNPTASTTATQTITAAQFGTSKSATVTCTVSGSYKDAETIIRLEKSTAAAGATRNEIYSSNTAPSYTFVGSLWLCTADAQTYKAIGTASTDVAVISAGQFINCTPLASSQDIIVLPFGSNEAVFSGLSSGTLAITHNTPSILTGALVSHSLNTGMIAYKDFVYFTNGYTTTTDIAKYMTDGTPFSLTAYSTAPANTATILALASYKKDVIYRATGSSWEAYSTMGAPTDTYVGGTLAQTVESNASTALSVANAATNAVANKLDKASSEILNIDTTSTTRVAGLRAGDLAWDTSGNRTSGKGVAITPSGILGHNGTKTTFAINATTGEAAFGGELSAASGSFSGTISASKFMTGAYTGWGWPAAGSNGSYLGSEGMLLGNYNNGKYFQVTSDGNVYAPGMKIENGTLTISQANVINTLQIAGNAVTIPVSAYTAAQITGATNTTTLDIQTAVILSTGAPITVFVSAEIGATVSGTASGTITGTVSFQILRNGVAVYTGGKVATQSVYNSSSSYYTLSPSGHASAIFVDTPGEGTHTYVFRVTGGQGYGKARALTLLETKR